MLACRPVIQHSLQVLMPLVYVMYSRYQMRRTIGVLKLCIICRCLADFTSSNYVIYEHCRLNIYPNSRATILQQDYYYCSN
jgi:hypothetical protein